MKLRPYQNEAIEKTRIEIRGGKRRICFYSPTGSGKTVMGMAFIKAAMAKGKRVAFIANRITLVGQASQEFTDNGIDHGIIQGQNTIGMHKQCIICSIQTVARRGLPPVDLIVIDEAHGVPGSKDYLKVIFSNNALPIIGLTATPFSKGMAKVHPELLNEPLFESLVVATTIRDLIRDGYLVDCDIYAPSEPDLSGVKLKRNSFGEIDYDEQQLSDAVDKPKLIGDIVENWLKVSRGRPTVVFATSVAHSRHIVEQFESAGIKAGHIDGYMDEDERGDVLGKMKRGEISIVSNVAVLREGWNFPACEIMILARPTKSLIAYIQMVGRVLRTFPGKERAIVLDHSGSTHELGYPTEDLPLELCDGTAKASEKKKAEKKEKKPAKCPQCQFVKPAGVHACPKCGYAPVKKEAMNEEDGDLELVDRSAKGSLAKANKQSILSQLVHIQHERGYADGWTANQYRKIFGVWPRGLEFVPSEPKQEVRNYIKGQLIRFVKGKQKQEMRHAA